MPARDRIIGAKGGPAGRMPGFHAWRLNQKVGTRVQSMVGVRVADRGLAHPRRPTDDNRHPGGQGSAVLVAHGRRLSVVLAVIGLAVVAPSRADPGFGGSVVLTTDYVFRGLSQTKNEGAIQGDLHYQWLSGWFAGAWASNIRFQAPDSPNKEYNLYLGYARQFTSDWSARATVVHYGYPGGSSDYNYDELAVGTDYQNRLFLTVAWAPNVSRYSYYYGAAHHRSEISYELNARQPLKFGISAAAGAGYYDLTDLFGSTYWAANGGLVYALGDFQLDVTYYWVSNQARVIFGPATAHDHWVATLLWRF
jgi:uncharacterized protein (TIGR02001 family)